MKKNLFFLLLFSAVLKSNAQHLQPFRIICDTQNFVYAAPFLYPDLSALSDELDDKGTLTPQKKSAPFEFNVYIKSPSFVRLVNVMLLAIPGQTIKGTLTSSSGTDRFVIEDSNSINFLLQQFEWTVRPMMGRFTKASSYNDYLKLYDSVRAYTVNMINYVNSPEGIKKYHSSSIARAAVAQYCKATLASFILFPVYGYSGFADYPKKMRALIKRDISIETPAFWMQSGIGRGFLFTYFNQFVMPAHHFDLQQSFDSDSLFRSKEIQKYLGYRYFSSSLRGDHSTAVNALIDSINQFEKKYQFEEKDRKFFKNIKDRLLLSSGSIADMFVKQQLVNYNEVSLENEKAALLKKHKRLILYYWASWCVPCMETISKLPSGKVMIDNEEYQLVFISIDKKQQQWANVKASCLSAENSFRLIDPDSNSFYRNFEILSVPRLFLIKDGRVIDQDFSKDKLHETL